MFKENIGAFVQRADLCVFRDIPVDSSNHSSSRATFWKGRDVFVASDSLFFKESLAGRWQGEGWRLHFFTTTGARFTTVSRPPPGCSLGFGARPSGSSVQWFEGCGGTISQFFTALEFWLLSRAAPLVSMAFFDVRLSTAQLPPESSAGSVRDPKGPLRALSTFSKAAALLGGLDAIEQLRQCTSMERGSDADSVARAGSGDCSTECAGRRRVFLP